MQPTVLSSYRGKDIRSPNSKTGHYPIFVLLWQCEMQKHLVNPPVVIPMELPMPLCFYEELGIASRTSIWRWEKEGLQVLRKGGRTYVIPDEIRAFFLRNTPLNQTNKEEAK